MTLTSVRGALVVLLAVFAMSGTLWVLAPVRAYASVVAGAAEITKPGSTVPLRSGGSSTPYGVLLPQGAHCPGDTAHDNYHVFSFLVRRGVPVSSVNFGGYLPSRGFGYIANGSYYGAINTAENTGLVAELPTEFTWSRLSPKDLFTKGESTATWDGGIACATARGMATDYWNTEVVFTASASDPGGFTWAVVGDDSPPSTPGQISWLVPTLPAVALVLGIGAFALKRPRAHERPGKAR